jgi:hypothetical protein
VKRLVAVGLVLALGLVTVALAGEEPKQRPPMANGTFVSATLAGELVKWEIDLGGDAGKKTYEMSADVKVQYADKDGVKQAQSIRAAAGRDFREKEGMVVAKGKFASAKIDGEQVVVTITPAEGDKPLVVNLPVKLSVMYQEADGKLTAFGIGVPRAPRPPKAEGK